GRIAGGGVEVEPEVAGLARPEPEGPERDVVLPLDRRPPVVGDGDAVQGPVVQPAARDRLDGDRAGPTVVEPEESVERRAGMVVDINVGAEAVRNPLDPRD